VFIVAECILVSDDTTSTIDFVVFFLGDDAFAIKN